MVQLLFVIHFKLQFFFTHITAKKFSVPRCCHVLGYWVSCSCPKGISISTADQLQMNYEEFVLEKMVLQVFDGFGKSKGGGNSNVTLYVVFLGNYLQ